MLDRNIKSLNNMLVKINENMFGGSTKRPPPPPPIKAASAEKLSAIAYLPSAPLRVDPQIISLQTLKPSGSTVTLASCLRSADECGSEIVARGALICSSKTMSMSSFPATPTILSTQRLQKSATSPPHVTVTSRPTQAAVTTALFADRAKLSRTRQHLHQQQQFHHHHQYAPQLRFRLLPGLKATSFFTILTLVCLETVLLSTVSNCAKTFYMHWNTSNSIFRIDNTDHIIDVNKGNLAFEFDQVHIICPVYEPGTFENETEKYIIYNVSKVEYETCRITNADPRVIAICDKPQKLMFFTITFRPFTPQPGGLEFLPGNDYYFISTSSKGDLYRRIGGRCSTNNMKVVFKVCCAPEDKNNRTNNNINGSGIGNSGNSGVGGGGGNGGSGGSGGGNSNTAIQQQQHNNNININGGNIGGGTALLPSPKLTGMGGGGAGGSGMNGMSNGGVIGGGGGLMINGNSGTSINTNIDQFNRIPMQQPNNIGGMGMGIGVNGNIGMSGIGGGSGGMGQHQTGIRINNVPSSQQHPSQKNDDYDKHPNEVVKNEELTYNSAASSLSFFKTRRRTQQGEVKMLKALRYNNNSRSTSYKSIYRKFKSLLQLLHYAKSNHCNPCNPFATIINFIHNCNPIIITTTVLVALTNLLQYKIMTSWSDGANSDTLKKNEQNPDNKTTRCQGRLLMQTRKFVNSLPSFRRRQDEEKEGDLPPSTTQRLLSSTADCEQLPSSITTTTTNINYNINSFITR